MEINNFITYIIMDVINHSCLDQSWTMGYLTNMVWNIIHRYAQVVLCFVVVILSASANWFDLFSNRTIMRKREWSSHDGIDPLPNHDNTQQIANHTCTYILGCTVFNSLRARNDDHCNAHDIFKLVFLNENAFVLILLCIYHFSLLSLFAL